MPLLLVLLLLLQISPRANIFRRDQGNVHTLQDLKHMMRYNNWKNDSYSGDHPTAAVCSRADLESHKSKLKLPKGCYDSKVTEKP